MYVGDCMIIGYIKEENLKPLKNIEIRFYGKNYIIVLAKGKKDKNRIRKKLVKYIQSLKIDILVFSKELEDFKPVICEMLSSYNVQVLNGKKLMEFMGFEVVKYVLNKQKANMKEEEIYIVFKKSGDIDLNFLKKFIERFRTVNIVTNDLERLKNELGSNVGTLLDTIIED